MSLTVLRVVGPSAPEVPQQPWLHSPSDRRTVAGRHCAPFFVREPQPKPNPNKPCLLLDYEDFAFGDIPEVPRSPYSPVTLDGYNLDGGAPDSFDEAALTVPKALLPQS